jgi:hypothetical protein
MNLLEVLEDWILGFAMAVRSAGHPSCVPMQEQRYLKALMVPEQVFGKSCRRMSDRVLVGHEVDVEPDQQCRIG